MSYILTHQCITKTVGPAALDAYINGVLQNVRKKPYYTTALLHEEKLIIKVLDTSLAEVERIVIKTQ